MVLLALTNFWSNFTLIVSILYGLTVLFIVLLIILENRDPVKTISWFLVILLIPVVGVIFYILFGQNYRKQKIFSRKGLKDLTRLAQISKKQVLGLQRREILSDEKIKGVRNIMMLLLKNSKAILTEWNQVEIMSRGENVFESILNSINEAEDHIHMEFYRWESDQIGSKIKKALIKKVRQGVNVRVIYDDVGSWSIGRTYIKSLKKEGIKAFPFMPVKFPYFSSKVNFRNHRKIMIVDGKVGYVGGFNIADKYIYGTKKLGEWRDTHLKIIGEAVRPLQSIFAMDWFFVSGRILGTSPAYFPDIRAKDRHLIQITACGPDSDWASIMQAYLASIASAKHQIYISTPYFSPNEAVFSVLCTAALSGVEVKLLLPARSDSTVSFWNSFSYIGRMLEAGIEVYLYKKGFNHSKIIMVDGIFSSVGTANFDNRSFDLNFEVNALIYDESLTHELVEVFRKDLGNSQKLKLSQWRKRSFIQKFKESTARILGPLY